MAKPNHPTSATNNDRNVSSPSVSPDAEQARAGISRRNIMTMMSAVVATPALAFAPTQPTLAAKNRKAWDLALKSFRRAELEFDRRCRAYDVAEEAWDNDCPREDRFFREYGLSMGMSRDEVRQAALRSCCVRDAVGGLILYPPEKVAAQKECCAKINNEADRIADEFMAYQARDNEGRRLHRVDELSAEVDTYRPIYFAARDKLLRSAAPDHQALLLKLELAFESRENDHEESALADARRLLTTAH